MLRRGLILAVAFSVAASAAIWREPPGQHHIRSTRAVGITADRALWDEYGLASVERADFGRYQAVAYQFKDTTGSYAADVWIKSTDHSAALLGSLVVTCSGDCPKPAVFARFLDPAETGHTTFSNLPLHLPQRDRIASSERYILGPVSLARFAPLLPVQAVDFQFSTEAAVSRYRSAKGDLSLSILSYPTPQIARQQAVLFQKLPGALVKRAGPLLAVVPSPPDVESAARLLSEVSYNTSVNWDVNPPDPKLMSKVASMLLGIAELTGLVVLLCIVGGIAVGGVRVLSRRFGHEDADGPMILLHLTDK